MVKRKISDTKFNPKKTNYIDIIYLEFDPDSDEDPEWLPEDLTDSESETESEESNP